MFVDSSLPTKETKLPKKVSECTLGKFFHFPFSFLSLSLSQAHYLLSLPLSSSHFLPDYYYLLLVQKLHAIIWKATFLIIKLHQRKNSPTTKESKALLKRFPFLLFYCQNLPFNCSRKKMSKLNQNALISLDEFSANQSDMQRTVVCL